MRRLLKITVQGPQASNHNSSVCNIRFCVGVSVSDAIRRAGERN